MTSKSHKPSAKAAQIRALRPGDIAACAALVASTPLWQRYGYDAARCAADLGAALARKDDLHVAVDGAAVLGLAWVLPRGGFGRSPYLKLLAVAESARGLGVGALLLRAAEHRGELFLLVSDFNRGARRFYRREGYRRLGALPDYVVPGVTELLLHRRISSRLTPRVTPKTPGPRSRPRR